QFLPWLNVSLTGIVGVSWLDRRDDPSNVRYRSFAAASRNGTAWSINRRVGTALSNPFNDGFSGAFIGDYTGNTWTSNSVNIAWTDTRVGSARAFTGGFAF
ncbi:MAG TPA: hypothetical protein VKA30_04955, partial [Actinomycetota bacterium]|nr:hypothetical protein [Actinomycetota bacterium]